MKRLIILSTILAVGVSLAGWRQDFDEQFAAALNRGTPIPAVAWYKLDGNARDSSGNGRDGTWTGTEAYTNGPFAGTQAGSFDGTAKIGIGQSAVAGSQSLALTFWINLGGLPTAGRQHIGVFGEYGVRTGGGGNNLNFNVWNSDNVRHELLPGVAVQVGSWVHYAMIWDGGEQMIYIGGIKSVSVTRAGSANVADISANHEIGPTMAGSAIADVRIYDRALSQANIQRIMESQDNEPLEELQ